MKYNQITYIRRCGLSSALQCTQQWYSPGRGCKGGRVLLKEKLDKRTETRGRNGKIVEKGKKIRN